MFRRRFFNEERPFRGHRQESYFQKGDLKYIILDLIKDKPRHGYEVIRELEEQSHGLYKPSPGVVYPTLQMLEDMEYVSVAERDGKKIYTITEQGEQFLAEQKEQAEGVRKQMKSRWSFKKIGRMAMMMKEYHALEDLMGRGLRSLDEDKTERIRQVLIQAAENIEEILEN
jgi:DNA-binding PadR family transcriptional regulator